MKQKNPFRVILTVFSLLSVILIGVSACDGVSQNPMDEVTGNWTGRGSGEEVRYRNPLGLLTLTVRHETEFFFHVDDTGRIEGEGTILYDMTSDPQGLDRLVAAVEGTIALVPTLVPKMPDSLDILDTPEQPRMPGDIADRLEDRMQKGTNRLDYKAPQMKHGTELRHYRFHGHVVEEAGKPIALQLEQTSGYRRPDRKRKDLDEFSDADDQQLVVTWEVNRVREERSFPCWSPFLEGSAELRRGPGGIWVAELIESGEHREGKSVWQEYSYVWMARRLAAE
jgi:hypothetical protein